MTIVETGQITGGVDTHLDAHVTAALDGNGGTLGVESFPTTTNQLRHLGFCGPDDLRERFRGVTVDTLPQTAAAMRPDSAGDPVMYATKLAMQTFGRRVLDIDADCARLHGELTDLVKATAQSLLDRIGDRDDVTAIRIGRRRVTG